LNNPPNSQRLERAQSQLVHAQLTPHSHTQPQMHVGVQEQGEAQTQLLVVMLALFASVVVVFMRHLVFGLPESYWRRAPAS
jgi:hypothetical protein